MAAPPSRSPACRSRSAPRSASTWASRVRTSRSPPASPAVSPCACSMMLARKPRSRCGTTTPMSGMRSCRESARASPTGTGSAGPGTRPAGLRCNPAKLLLDPYAKAVSGAVSFGPEVLGQSVTDGDAPSTLDSSAHVPRSLVVDPAFSWQDEQTPLVPLRGHGPVRGPRQGLHHAPSGYSRGAARDLRRPGPRGRDRRTCSTWASPRSSCSPSTRTCPRRSWSSGG